MRKAGRQAWVRVGLTCAAALFACKSAPRARAPPPAAARANAPGSEAPEPRFPRQPGTVIAQVDGAAVLALSAPSFAAVSREQRLVAWWAAQALAAGDALAAEQGYRQNLNIIRILRGILMRPQAVPAQILRRIRDFARVVYLNHGIHDPETGRKRMPSFSAAELRTAALAAQASGAGFDLHGAALEYALRALDGPLFDPRVAPVRTAHGKDLTASAVNLYDGVTLQDLETFRERAPLSSQLVKEHGVVSERPYKLPAAADALDRALPYAAPPQRALIESLASFLRSGEPDAAATAERNWAEAFGPVDFFAGFFDTSADPRGRKALFGGAVGVADPDRSQALQLPGRRPAEALFLVAAAGAFRPVRTFALAVPEKAALFAAAQEAAAQVGSDKLIAALADPRFASQLSRCGPSQRFALLALRELSRTGTGALDEALADVNAHLSAATALELMPDAACRELWPQFAALRWLASLGAVEEGDRVEDDRVRAAQLQIWWFSSNGALVERRSRGARYYTVPDPARFQAMAMQLRNLLLQERAAGEAGPVHDLLERHAGRVDPHLREEVRSRLSGIPRRVAVLPPRLEAVLRDGAVVDAQAVPVEDLDDQVLRDWARY
jgi:peptidase M49-like protein